MKKVGMVARPQKRVSRSNPADRARSAPSTCSRCIWRISRLVIARQLAAEMSEAIWLAPRAGRRVSPLWQSPPPWVSSTPGSDPWSRTRSVISARFRMSPLSQSLQPTQGTGSLSADIRQTSVNTAAQPPSAFMARNSACIPGLSLPAPLQCGTCQKRFRRVLGPTGILSNRTSNFASRAMGSPFSMVGC